MLKNEAWRSDRIEGLLGIRLRSAFSDGLVSASPALLNFVHILSDGFNMIRPGSREDKIPKQFRGLRTSPKTDQKLLQEHSASPKQLAR